MAKDRKEKKEQDPSFLGKSTSKTLKHGPLEKRRCTDVLCLLLFLGFWAGVGMIGVYSINHVDDFKTITYVYDQTGNHCKDEFPVLFFINNNENFAINNTVCVDHCPKDGSSEMKCSPSFDESACGSLTKYSTTLFLGRVCWPSDPNYQSLLNRFKVVSASFLMKTFADLKLVWWMIPCVGLTALILGFLYLFLLKHFSGVIIWAVLVSILASVTGFSLVCAGCAWGSLNLKDLLPTWMEDWGNFELGATAIAGMLLSLLILTLICSFRSRINLSIAVLKTSTEFVKDEGHILLIPPLFFILSLIFYCVWVIIFIYIVQTNEIKQDEEHNPLPIIFFNAKSEAMMVYYFFALLWNHSFGVALSNFIIASAVCLWYFKKGRSHLGKSPVWTSIKRSFIHLGSIALSSFIIGVLDFIRAIMGFLHGRFKWLLDSDYADKGYCLKCCECFLTCFEKSLKFLNRHAYIQMAMTGEGFCKSTEEAFYLLLRNGARFGVVHGLAWIFLNIGKIFIACLATFLGYLIITGSQTFSEKLYSPISPTIFFFAISYLVSHVIMGVYGISADTIIHCFAMDEEINDGIAEHAPLKLREFVDTHDHKKLLP